MTVKKYMNIKLKESTTRLANILVDIGGPSLADRTTLSNRKFSWETYNITVLDLDSYVHAMNCLSQIREYCEDNGYESLVATNLNVRVDEALKDIDLQVRGLDTFAKDKGIL